MRGLCLALIAATGSVAGANIAVAEQARIASPSIIYLGSAETPSPQASHASMSIISLGEPGVEDINVAAVGKKSQTKSMPMVMRGGIVGNAFTAPLAAPAATPADDTKAAPANPAPEQAQADATPPAIPDMGNQAPPMAPGPAAVSATR